MVSSSQNGGPPAGKRKLQQQQKPAGPELQSASEYNKTSRGSAISKSKEGSKEKPSDTESVTQAISYTLETRFFDIGIGLVVVANAICIGIELSLSLEKGDTTVVKAFDIFFLVVYTVELVMRFWAYGFFPAFKRPWVPFDFALVLLGLVGTLVLEPIANSTGGSNALGSVMVLRMLRLLRLGRTLRLFKLFKQLAEFLAVLRGLVSSIGLIAGTFFTLVLVLYVFACLGLELITKSPLNETSPAFHEQAQQNFGNLAGTMVTLLRFATLDNINEIYMPLIAEEPLLFLYFGGVIVVVTFCCANVLTAVVFTSIMKQDLEANEAAKAQWKEDMSDLVNDLKIMFFRLDRDGSGLLSREELMRINAADKAKLNAALNMTSPLEIFTALDIDNSGELSITEFFDGALDIMLRNQQGRESELILMKRIERTVDVINKRVKDFVDAQNPPAVDPDMEDSMLSSGNHNFSQGEGTDEFTLQLQKIWEEAKEQSLQLALGQLQDPSKERQAAVIKNGQKHGTTNGFMLKETESNSEHSDSSAAASNHGRKARRSRSQNSTPRSKASSGIKSIHAMV